MAQNTIVVEPAVEDLTNGASTSSPNSEKAGDDQVTSSSPPPRNVNGFGWFVVVTAILSSTFLFALDNTIAANVAPAIESTFNDVGRLAWISVAYLLGAASMTLFWYVPRVALFPIPNAASSNTRSPGVSCTLV